MGSSDTPTWRLVGGTRFQVEPLAGVARRRSESFQEAR